MAAKRSRARQFSGGGFDLGGLLSVIDSGSGEVENVPKPEDINATTDKPYDWSGDKIPSDNIRTKKLSEKSFSDMKSGNLFKGKGSIGTELASKGNIENTLAEEQAKRGIRTKISEGPIEATNAAQKETALNAPRLELHKALGTQTLQQELDRRAAMDPKDIEQERQRHIMALVTSQGMQPTPENIAKADALLSGINLSKQAEEGYEGINKAKLGNEDLSRQREIAAKNKNLNMDIAYKGAQFGSIAADQALAEQPQHPAIREEERMKANQITMTPGESLYNRIKPKAPIIHIPTQQELTMQAGRDRASGIKPSTGTFGSPALGNVQDNTPGSTYPDPDDPTKDIMVLPGGQKIRVTRKVQ